MKQAKFMKLGWSDLGKGLILAMLTPLLTGCGMYLNNGHLPTHKEFVTLSLVALGAGIAYLLKNLFTNSDNKLMKKEDNSILKH